MRAGSVITVAGLSVMYAISSGTSLQNDAQKYFSENS